MKKSIKLSSELNIFVSLLLFVVFFFQAIICMYCLRLVEDKKTAWETGIVRDFENYISTNLQELEAARKNLINTDELVVGLKSEKSDFSALREKIYNLQEFSDGVIHAIAFKNSGEIVDISGNVSDREREEVKNSFLLYIDEYEKEIKSGGDGSHFDFFEFADGENQELYFLSFYPVREYNNKTSKEDTIGYLCTFNQVDPSVLFSGHEDVSDIYISLKSNISEKEIKIGAKKNANFLLTAKWKGKKVSGTPWYTDGSITLSASRFDGATFLKMIIWESLILVALTLIMHHSLKRKTIEPLKKIGKLMRYFRISDSFKPLEIDANAELEEFAEEVNKMVKRNKVLANDIMLKQGKLYEAENQKNEATLYALQNQVNPHYLYNIFELIRSIALVRGVKEIETISVSVSEIFRYNLKKENTALLSEEYAITKRYISIMQVKYGDSFDVIYELEKETLDKRIMRMMFQPLIENAFGHGYVRKSEKFFVKIRSWMEGNTLCVSFYDNGLGMTKERLEEVTERIKTNKMTNGKGIGITNLAHRLKMMYGKNCAFRVNSEKDKFTEIIITINM